MLISLLVSGIYFWLITDEKPKFVLSKLKLELEEKVISVNYSQII